MALFAIDASGNKVLVSGSGGGSGGQGGGLPAGGIAGQVLTKKSGNDYDASWESPAAVTSLILTDATTGKQYTLVVDNGVLYLEEV